MPDTIYYCIYYILVVIWYTIDLGILVGYYFAVKKNTLASLALFTVAVIRTTSSPRSRYTSSKFKRY